jgi:hypothetical protein
MAEIARTREECEIFKRQTNESVEEKMESS